jgi:hypothetical protein
VERLVKVCFELLGTELSPREISQRTGITPSVELGRGERNPARDLPRQNIWALESQLESHEVAEHWQELLPALDSARDTIKEIAKRGTAKFTIVVDSQHRLPSIIIPSSMSEFAGFVNAVIDIDHLQ